LTGDGPVVGDAFGELLRAAHAARTGRGPRPVLGSPELAPGFLAELARLAAPGARIVWHRAPTRTAGAGDPVHRV
jgi:hypothetical protein